MVGAFPRIRACFAAAPLQTGDTIAQLAFRIEKDGAIRRVCSTLPPSAAWPR